LPCRRHGIGDLSERGGELFNVAAVHRGDDPAKGAQVGFLLAA
jgi:hypothetical protein